MGGNSTYPINRIIPTAISTLILAPLNDINCIYWLIIDIIMFHQPVLDSSTLAAIYMRYIKLINECTKLVIVAILISFGSSAIMIADCASRVSFIKNILSIY